MVELKVEAALVAFCNLRKYANIFSRFTIPENVICLLRVLVS